MLCSSKWLCVATLVVFISGCGDSGPTEIPKNDPTTPRDGKLSNLERTMWNSNAHSQITVNSLSEIKRIFDLADKVGFVSGGLAEPAPPLLGRKPCPEIKQTKKEGNSTDYDVTWRPSRCNFGSGRNLVKFKGVEKLTITTEGGDISKITLDHSDLVWKRLKVHNSRTVDFNFLGITTLDRLSDNSFSFVQDITWGYDNERVLTKKLQMRVWTMLNSGVLNLDEQMSITGFESIMSYERSHRQARSKPKELDFAELTMNSVASITLDDCGIPTGNFEVSSYSSYDLEKNDKPAATGTLKVANSTFSNDMSGSKLTWTTCKNIKGPALASLIPKFVRGMDPQKKHEARQEQ